MMHRSRSDQAAYDDEADEDPRPRKQRKQRPCYSCAECRRLKMRCDRQEPCANCIRRHRVEFCIAATGTNYSRQSSNWHQMPQKDTEQAEPENRQNISPHNVLEEPQETNSVQQSVDHDLIQDNPNNYNEFNPLPLINHAFDHYTVPDATSSSDNQPRHSIDHGRQGDSHGTLMLSTRGRSKYLGPTAGSEWLKESEMQDVPDSPLMTRVTSPELRQDPAPSQPSLSTSYTTSIGFPVNASPAHISTRHLLSCLPPRDEAWSLAESYYRYCAWHHDVAPRPSFEKTFDRIYKHAEKYPSSSPINPQEIALVYIIMALGTVFNIEMPNYDSSAEDWLHLSERALVKGDFLSNNMVAGLQTLHLMAHLHLILDKGRRGDNAWPLWGLVMRLIQAMGMHRDGDRWNLSRDVAEERRKVFWECHSADIFQAHCFSRPSAINPDHCDTAFPSESPKLTGEKGYSILRFELSQLSSEILNMAMKIRKPAYSDVMDLDLRLREFEQNIPFSLRCRAALLATPSRYPQLSAAIEASPEPSRRSLAISFQQTNLALNVSETIINLHRPYYAKALYEVDSIESIYKSSFYTVIERCAIIISIVADIHARFPAVSTRQWNFWFHVFNSALCLGTLLLRDPGNAMASFVLAQIDAAIDLFTSLIQHGARTPRYKSNLQWLLNLRTRALSKIPDASIDTDRRSRSGRHDEHREPDEEDVELLGWRTRLIERVGHGRQKTVTTIHRTSPPTGTQTTNTMSSPLDRNHLHSQQGTADIVMPSTALSEMNCESTNDILRDFWDPMLLQDVFGPPNDQPAFLVNRNTWWDDTADTS
ncbi:fungal-specific transcription factor domain-containing protein [Annulohypoxylon maeteangense]|uniref:fungal-specific transcription factor domain-containing protein n=1 Tax=Annulohypoxylon maeteangense TaxID=1927788 RepID=UPI002008C89D|nr:fungal-specific transcription factor domain-containing protein [Annulohypoxylon maeteangense]KAI0886892.1 fungal-specific transcription factor domain-containing protein [Annulohypoxylon maeteangense]